MTYTVEVDEADTWTCTCPDFTHERDVPGRPRYFCKHCISVGYITGLKRPKRWRRRGGVEEWLVGEILTLDDGTSRMQVDGFVTSRELYEVHDMTPALVKKFLPTPDEEAVFQSSDGDGDGEDEGGCSLYSEVRVNTVLDSVEYLAERQETERRREGARKGNAKRAATMAGVVAPLWLRAKCASCGGRGMFDHEVSQAQPVQAREAEEVPRSQLGGIQRRTAPPRRFDGLV